MADSVQGSRKIEKRQKQEVIDNVKEDGFYAMVGAIGRLEDERGCYLTSGC